jgi:hypothetical protein
MIFRGSLLSVILFLRLVVFAQTRTVTGNMVDEHLQPVYEAAIYNVDTMLLGKTEIEGNFKIDIPVETKSLMVGSIGMEWRLLNLTDSCENLEIILLYSGNYDFMSARKLDRLEKKQFDKLPKLHETAHDRGLFKVAVPCYENKFISIRQRWNEIHKS